MSRRFARLVLLVFVLLLSGCLLGGWWFVDWAYLRHQRAYARWQALEPPHYSYRVSIQGFGDSVDWRVEAWRGGLPRVLDVANQRPPEDWDILFTSPFYDLSTMAYFMSQVLRPPSSLGQFVARYLPRAFFWAAGKGWYPGGWVNCEAAMPIVEYDPQFSYPALVQFQQYSCYNRWVQPVPTQIKITEFKVLP